MKISELYRDLIETKFPNQIDDWERYIDPTSKEIALIKKYQDYFDTGQISKSEELLNQNPILKRMIINAQTMNQTRDAIIATQKFYSDDVQKYLVNIVKYRGDFKFTSSYTKYDVVYYESNYVKKPYMAIQISIPVGTLPTNTDYFIPLAIQGQDGVGLKFKGNYTNNIQYYKDDCVSYNDVLWFAMVDNINEIPTETSSVWGIVFRNFQSKDPSVTIGTIAHNLGCYPDCRLYKTNLIYIEFDGGDFRNVDTCSTEIEYFDESEIQSIDIDCGDFRDSISDFDGNLISIPAEFELNRLNKVTVKTIAEFESHTIINRIGTHMYSFTSPYSTISLVLFLSISKNISNINGGYFEGDGGGEIAPVIAHNMSPTAHRSMVVDGSLMEVVDGQITSLEDHSIDPNAHQNITLDGNML